MVIEAARNAANTELDAQAWAGSSTVSTGQTKYMATAGRKSPPAAVQCKDASEAAATHQLGLRRAGLRNRFGTGPG